MKFNSLSQFKQHLQERMKLLDVSDTETLLHFFLMEQENLGEPKTYLELMIFIECVNHILKYVERISNTMI